MKLSRLTTFIHSIRFRLTLWFTAILTLVLLAFSGFIYLNQMRDIRGDALFRLERKLNSIEEALSDGHNSPVLLQEQDILLVLGMDGSVLLSQGIDATEMLGLANNGLRALQTNRNQRPDAVISWIQELTAAKQHYFLTVKRMPIFEQPAYVMLGSPFDPYDLDKRLIATLLLGSLLTIAVASGGGLRLADRAMRPVHTITQAARAISETDLSRRLNLDSRDELGELASTFDAMLARLQAAFERQRQFVADASHELRTPLTIVNLEASRALAAKRTAPEYQRALGIIRSENEFMTHLVNDLLTLARMDSGQMAMEKLPLDLSDLALEAVERLAPLAERNGVTLATGDLPETNILGDRQYVLQMMSNLIENGIKYTRGEVRRVSVETGVDAESAWVRVADTGAGIPPEHLPHLFDRFYRVDNARTRSDDDAPAGNGLGLSIVQWIAQAHGGAVTVESVVGEGTTFEIWFRLE
jgi:heavy metal sensor kinase